MTTFGGKPKTGGGGGTGAPGRGVSGFTRVNSRTLRQTFTDNGTQDVLLATNRGPWTANTDYLQGDTYTYQLQLYTSNTDHNSGATWNLANSTLSVAKGVDGAVGPSPLLLTGVTGGTNNRLLYINSDGVTAAELHPSMLDQINYKTLAYQDNSGQLWLPGAVITEPAGANLPADTVRALQGKTSAGAVNWRDIDPKAAQPADLVATVNQAYVEFGRNISPTSWRFVEPKADGLLPAPVSRFDGFLVANYPRGAAVPAGRFQINQWTPFDGAVNPSYTTAQTLGTNYPYAASIGFTGTTSFATRVATDQVSGQAADGQVRALVQKGGGAGTMGVGMRVTGTSTTKSGILVVLDDGQPATNCFTLQEYLGNVTRAVQVYPNFTLVHGNFYHVKLECAGTLIRAKAWPVAATEPTDWMLSGYTTLITPGYFAITANIETVNVSSYSTVVNIGAQAALTGAT